MTLKESIAAAFPALKGACRKGKQALSPNDADKIVCVPPVVVGHSVNLDACARKGRERENRWDYGLALANATTNSPEYVIWVEVHKATCDEVSCLLKKRDWLQAWLKDNAPALYRKMGNTLDSRNCYWLATKGVHIAKGSRHYRLLAEKGLLPRSRLKLTEELLKP